MVVLLRASFLVLVLGWVLVAATSATPATSATSAVSVDHERDRHNDEESDGEEEAEEAERERGIPHVGRHVVARAVEPVAEVVDVLGHERPGRDVEEHDEEEAH